MDSSVLCPGATMEVDEAVESGIVSVDQSTQLGDSEMLLPIVDPVPVPVPAAAADVDDEILEKIIKQVEYYFSDENLPTDKFMLGQLKRNKQGFVPLSVIASFKKLKKLTKDLSVIVTALKRSSHLVVSPDGSKVKRKVPFNFKNVESKDHSVGLGGVSVVLVENLPEDRSVENLQKIFGVVGSVKKISVIDPKGVEELKGDKGQMMLIGGNKVHALVEYETVEAAEKAVSTLNCDSDWRSGMRVKLMKHKDKYGSRKSTTGWRGGDKKNTHLKGPNTSEHQGEGNSGEDGMPVKKEKAEPQGHGHGRSKGKKQYNSFGHCIGSAAAHLTETPKPPSGPKMPDGTKGFSVGRGRPLASIPN